LGGARLLCYQHIRSKPEQATNRQNRYFLHSRPRGRPKLPFVGPDPVTFVSPVSLRND
jgi:hypothetical protein